MDTQPAHCATAGHSRESVAAAGDRAVDVSFTERKEEFIYGLKRIGQVLSRSDQTVRRWIRNYGFPAAVMPNGEYITSLELIRRWILVIGRAQGENQE